MAPMQSDAATMSFDSLSYPAFATTYSENGITATSLQPGGILAPFTNGFAPGTLHIDDAGTSHTNGAGFTLDSGSLFDSAVFSLTSLGYDAYYASTLGGALPWNISISGYYMGTEIAMQKHQLSDIAGTLQNILFSAPGALFDRVSIQLNYPVGTIAACAPCGHFDINDVTISPVPLPAAGLVLTSGLALMAGFGWRRRRTA